MDLSSKPYRVSETFTDENSAATPLPNKDSEIIAEEEPPASMTTPPLSMTTPLSSRDDEIIAEEDFGSEMAARPSESLLRIPRGPVASLSGVYGPMVTPRLSMLGLARDHEPPAIMVGRLMGRGALGLNYEALVSP